MVVLILLPGVSAIKLIKDERPPNIPADAPVNVSEYTEPVQTITVHPTRLSIERKHPMEAAAGSSVTITLKLINAGSESVRATIFEDQRPGLTYPDPALISYLQYQGLRIPYFTWNVTLPAGSERTVTYHAMAQSPGMITFSSALLWDEFGNLFESAPTHIRITCVPNGRCDTGENTIYCPADCPSGSADGICDGIADNRIDPDCVTGYDPDAGIKAPKETTKALIEIPIIILACAAGFVVIARIRK